MGIRGINPMVFNTFVANQVDPALNIGGRPVAPRANANSQADAQDGDGIGSSRGDQLRINQMDLAVAGVQDEDTGIDGSQTQLDPSRLRQEVGQRAATDRGHHLDIIT